MENITTYCLRKEKNTKWYYFMFVNKQKTKNKILHMQGKKDSNAKYPNISTYKEM